MKLTKWWKISLVSLSVVSLLLIGPLGMAQAAEKTFEVVTGEWKWTAKTGEAPVTNRGKGTTKKIERYVFNPGFIMVNKGDSVTLRIHDVKGSKHQIKSEALGIPETLVQRGEMKTIKFTANTAGTFVIDCGNHIDETKEGPMELYVYVVDR